LAAVVGVTVGSVLGAVLQAPARDIVRRVAGDAALTAVVQHDAALVSDGWIVAIAGELLAEKRPREGTSIVGAHSHLMRHDAYDVDTTHVRLTLQNSGTLPIVITEINAVVVGREPPIAGVRVRSVTAGAIDVSTLKVMLDGRSPKLRDRKGRDYFRRHALTLAPGESHIYAIAAVASREALVWEFEVMFTLDGQPAVIRVPAEKLRTTARVDRYARSYEWVWYEHPQRIVERRAANAEWP
jgi:hypothetical protein